VKKTTDGKDVGGDSDLISSESPLVVPFRIETFSVVDYGRKRGVGRIEVDGLGVIDFDLFVAGGGVLNVNSGSTRDTYSGRWRRHVKFSDEFAAALLEAVVARLDAEAYAE
jgi:hypothetical protein